MKNEQSLNDNNLNIKKKEENSGDLDQYLKKVNKCVIDYKKI